VDGDAVYFPDWAGNLFAVKKDSGRLIWSHKISEYDGVQGAISRVSPAVDANHVIIGDILSGNKVHNGANVMAVDRESGNAPVDYAGGNSSGGNHYRITGCFRRRCLHWRLIERGSSGT